LAPAWQVTLAGNPTLIEAPSLSSVSSILKASP
jgi:hypothetical protein